jgi:hypothetical protein
MCQLIVAGCRFSARATVTTEASACRGGCSWVAEGLCSACARPPADGANGGANGEGGAGG